MRCAAWCVAVVQLEMREPEMAEEMFVQGLCVLTSTEQPDRDRGVSTAEDPQGFGWVEPFGQRPEHQRAPRRPGTGRRFQTIQGGVAAGAERSAASRTSKGLDRLSTPMLAIPKKPRALERQCCQSTSTAGSDRRTLRWGCEWRAPRRLLTSHQGRTGADAGPLPDEGAEARRQAGNRVESEAMPQTGERSAHLGCSRLARTRMRPAQGTRASPKSREVRFIHHRERLYPASQRHSLGTSVSENNGFYERMPQVANTAHQ